LGDEWTESILLPRLRVYNLEDCMTASSPCDIVG
jgi:hypothetical protein